MKPKLWSEREHGECCYPVGGYGRDTLVCASFSLGAYCPAHRRQMDEAWCSNPSNGRKWACVQAAQRIAAE